MYEWLTWYLNWCFSIYPSVIHVWFVMAGNTVINNLTSEKINKGKSLNFVTISRGLLLANLAVKHYFQERGWKMAWFQIYATMKGNSSFFAKKQLEAWLDQDRTQRSLVGCFLWSQFPSRLAFVYRAGTLPSKQLILLLTSIHPGVITCYL